MRESPARFMFPLLLVVVLPASFIMGFSFPVVQKAVQRDIGRLGQRVGLVQLANIFGNSAGSLVAGLLLLDQLGTAGGPADRRITRGTLGLPARHPAAAGTGVLSP